MGNSPCSTSEHNNCDAIEESHYDLTKSTEHNFSVQVFSGSYSALRGLLDYSWHKVYSQRRVELQDFLVEEFSQAADSDKCYRPWVVFTCGAMGAGKAHVRTWLGEQGYWPSERFAVIDPHLIRQQLPEWEAYLTVDAQHAIDMTHKEAGCIAELAAFEAISHRRNVVFDGTLHDILFWKKLFLRLQDDFGARIMIMHVVADESEVLSRAACKAKLTNLTMQATLLQTQIQASRQSVAVLAPFADFVVRVENHSGQSPKVLREPTAPKPSAAFDLTWEAISGLWDKGDRSASTVDSGALPLENLEARSPPT
eukprot:TRINITY_DN23893_c0_g2_i1.p1 TRINITY_DN23893_c0_g2~~TRINITY_DN23893_c0_g2_i1.p1  ORF type:complete len:321 (+),score=37.91 TRINITY_DN23893_c0_g2_i1:32-964(+)